MSTTHLATVSAMFEAFQRGDIPAVVARMSPDIDWEAWDDNVAQAAGVPWLQYRKGPDEVMGFFRLVGTWTFHRFEVKALMANDQQVAAEVELEADVPNGGRISLQELLLFTFGDGGKVVRFRHYLDTAKLIDLARRTGNI